MTAQNRHTDPRHTTPEGPKVAAEIIAVDPHADEVCCDGGNAALGHPLVYYSFDGRSSVTCGYCGRLFTKTTL